MLKVFGMVNETSSHHDLILNSRTHKHIFRISFGRFSCYLSFRGNQKKELLASWAQQLHIIFYERQMFLVEDFHLKKFDKFFGHKRGVSNSISLTFRTFDRGMSAKYSFCWILKSKNKQIIKCNIFHVAFY